MPVVNNTSLPKFALPGLDHRTLAGPDNGMKNLEMWAQTIAAGAGTPVHRHACEEAIVILEGSGTLTAEGGLTGTGGSVTTGFGPAAFHPPNHFPTTVLASSCEISPMTVMVVISGRNNVA